MSGFKLGWMISISAATATALTVLACSGEAGDDAASASSAVSGTVNLCLGQQANTFHCLDETRFELCTGFNSGFVIESCPPGLCATRHPPDKNPCVGAARATEIDGVPPTPPGQIDDTPPASTGSSSGTGGTTKGTSDAGSASSSSSGGSGSSASTGSSSSGGSSSGGNGGQCVGGPKFDPAGVKNVGNGHGQQFIGGQCLDTADCASGCCALPCGICSGPGAQFQAGKMGCGFGG